MPCSHTTTHTHAHNHTQAESYRALRSPDTRHVALADQAGSGKTLAYLLPLLQEIKAEEAAKGGPATVPGSPRVLVLTPTVGAWLRAAGVWATSLILAATCSSSCSSTSN